MVKHRIQVQIFPEFQGTAAASSLRRLAEHALDAAREHEGKALGLVLADDETVRRLNRDYRGLDETTDVLAFAFHHPGHYEGEGEPPRVSNGEAFVTLPLKESFLGEVIISFPQGVRQAREHGHPVIEELALLVTHGVLHLLGYDHLSPQEERLMKEREAAALAARDTPRVHA